MVKMSKYDKNLNRKPEKDVTKIVTRIPSTE